MSCTSDPQHSAQKCFHNHKWHYKVIHASLGREMRGAEIKSIFFFSPQTIPLLPLLELTMNKKYGSRRNVCCCKVSWGLTDVHWGLFSHPEGTGDTAPCIQKRICSTWPTWALPAPPGSHKHLRPQAGQDRHPRWDGQIISWECLLVFHSHKGSLSNYLIINTRGFGN